MKDFAVSSPQLLLNQAPISVLLLAFMVTFFDTVPDVQKIPRDTIVALFLSGLAAASLVSPTVMFEGQKSADIGIEFVTVLDYRTDECLDFQRRFERQDNHHPDIRMGQRGQGIDADRFIGYHLGIRRSNSVQSTLATLRKRRKRMRRCLTTMAIGNIYKKEVALVY